MNQKLGKTEEIGWILLGVGAAALASLFGFWVWSSAVRSNLLMLQIGLVLLLVILLGSLCLNIYQQHRLRFQAKILHTNQTQFNTFVQTMGDVIYTLDRDLHYTTVYGPWLEQTGLLPELILGRTADEIYDLKSAEVHRDAGLRALTGEQVIYEWVFENSDGARYYQTHLSPIRAGGTVVGLVGVGREISALKKTELALRESEARFRSVVEQSVDGVIIVDEEGVIIEFNLANERISRLTKAQALGNFLWDIQFAMLPEALQTPERLGMIKETVQKALQAGESVLFDRVIEAERVHNDGTAVIVEQRVFPIKTSRGYRLGSIVRDVTVQKAIEKELRQSEAHLRAMVSAIPDLMFIVDRKGVYLDFHSNDPALLLGEPEEIIGKTIHDFLSAEDAEAHLHAFYVTVETGQPQIYDYVMAVPAGVRHFESRLIPMDEERILFMIRDITEQKRQQALLLASLQEKEVMLKEIHHRVKNNMQIMVSLLSLQSDQIQDPLAREVFRDSQERIHSMAMVHEKLYRSPDLARINFSEYLLDLTLRLSTIFQRTTDVRVLVEADNFELGIDTAIPCGLIINELVSNALKYAYPTGVSGDVIVFFHKIAPAANSQEQTFFQMGVRDFGVGLPPGFDPTRTSSLGLQLVHILTGQLNGKLTIQRENGLAFEIEFSEIKIHNR